MKHHWLTQKELTEIKSSLDAVSSAFTSLFEATSGHIPCRVLDDLLKVNNRYINIKSKIAWEARGRAEDMGLAEDIFKEKP